MYTDRRSRSSSSTASHRPIYGMLLGALAKLRPYRAWCQVRPLVPGLSPNQPLSHRAAYHPLLFCPVLFIRPIQQFYQRAYRPHGLRRQLNPPLRNGVT